MSANNFVIVLTLPELKAINSVKSYSYKIKRESKVCSICHMCLVKKVITTR